MLISYAQQMYVPQQHLSQPQVLLMFRPPHSVRTADWFVRGQVGYPPQGYAFQQLSQPQPQQPQQNPQQLQQQRQQQQNQQQQQQQQQQPAAAGGGQQVQYYGEPETNLFIFHLPPEADENTLNFLFAPFGRLESVKVARNPLTQASRGFGFVKFVRTSDAAAALASLNGFAIGNKRLKVPLPPVFVYPDIGRLLLSCCCVSSRCRSIRGQGLFLQIASDPANACEATTDSEI